MWEVALVNVKYTTGMKETGNWKCAVLSATVRSKDFQIQYSRMSGRCVQIFHDLSLNLPPNLSFIVTPLLFFRLVQPQQFKQRGTEWDT
jgi:hypothetical protein